MSVQVSPARARARRVPATADRAGPGPARVVPVAVRTLGGFEVHVEGRPVEPTAWQSRKARDLLKLLVARRGRPTTRDMLMEALWPGSDPVALGPRLSVALSIARSVLDPGGARERDFAIHSDRRAMMLDLDNVDVDVERFLAKARAGLAGDDDALRAAESLYSGEFLEEDAYEDWSVSLREEARATFVCVSRRLAERARAAGDHDLAACLLHRILGRDGYDEHAHLALVDVLVAARRHGDARRAWLAYARRMAEIGIDPVPGPARPNAAESR